MCTTQDAQNGPSPKHSTSLLRTVAIAILVVLLGAATACGGSDATDEDAAGIRLVTADQGADLLADAPENLVVLDVRTPDEFAAGHIDGAIMIDFYEEDFATQLAELDPSVPYLLYCRSGNRSGQTTAILDELGFTDVADVDGGVVAWGASGHELVTP